MYLCIHMIQCTLRELRFQRKNYALYIIPKYVSVSPSLPPSSSPSPSTPHSHPHFLKSIYLCSPIIY